MRKRAKAVEESWKRADKDYQFAKKQKQKQMSELKRRADNLKKKLKDADKAREKRIQEIKREMSKALDKARRE